MPNKSKISRLSIGKFIKFVLLLIPIFFLFLVFFHQDIDFTQDLGRHLTIGKIIVEKGYIPRTNLFSYTFPQFAFINHHWGSEVVFFLIHKVFGINGLIILKVILSLSAFIFIYFKAWKNFSLPAIFAAAYLISNFYRWRTFIRPEIFGYFLFSLLLLIIYRQRERASRILWIFPFVILLWLNLHISFVFGLLVYTAFFIETLFLKKYKKDYLIIFLIMIPLLIINPYGIEGVLYPFEIFKNYGYSVYENQPFFFIAQISMNLPMVFFMLLLLLFLFSIPYLLFKKKYFNLIILSVTAVMTLISIRHAPFFALAFFYPLTEFFELVYRKLPQLIPKKKAILELSVNIVTVVLLTLFIYQSVELLTNNYQLKNNMMSKTGFGAFIGAKKMADFFLDNKLPGRIWNNFDIGSYLIYRFFPDFQVFVDGRPEAYPADFFQKEYIPMQENFIFFKELSERYAIRTVLYSHTDQTPWGQKFMSAISKDKNWKLVYFDSFGVIFTLSDSHQKLYLSDQKKLEDYAGKVIEEENDKTSLYRLARFFYLINQTDLASKAYKKSVI
jgi:hypothetical protein